MSTSIQTAREACLRSCRTTFWRWEQDKPDGNPFPKLGDVRRCEHGRIWTATQERTWGLLNCDIWGPLSRFWSPIRYARAIRALPSPAQPTERAEN